MYETFPKVLFITGIGTDVGKSIATGWLARELRRNGINAITQKFIQTGCHEYSEDIETHRRIMGIPLEEADLDHTTAPLILSYPASPELAARIDGVTVDFETAARSTAALAEKYDTVLIEGAGGLMVPLHREYLTADYITGHGLKTALVTGGRLGSISDTLLNLEIMERRGIDLYALIYNPWFDTDATIAADTKVYLRHYLASHFPAAFFIEMPETV